MASLMPQGWQHYHDDDGTLLSGGKVYAFEAGTSTPLETYTDQAGTVPHAHPIVLDARGEAVIFWGSAPYKVRVDRADDTTVRTQDNMHASADLADLASTASGKGDALIGVKLVATGSVARTQHDKNAETVSVKDFGAIGDGVTDDTAAIQAAVTNGGRVRFPAGDYLVSAQISMPSNVEIVGDGRYLSKVLRANNSVMVSVFGSTAQGASNVRIAGISIDCNAVGNPSPDDCIGIYFNDGTTTSTNIAVEHCNVFGFGTEAHGVNIAGWVGVTVSGNTFPDGGGPIFYHPVYLRRVGKVIVTNNIVKSVVTNACLKVEPLGGGGKVVISGNITDGGGRGIVLQSLDPDDHLDAVISGNVICNTTEYGVIHSKDTGGTTIENNVVVTDNVISNCFTGIAMFSAAQVLLSNNVIEGVTSRGIFTRTSSHIVCTGNAIRSSATIDAAGVSLIEIQDGSSGFSAIIAANILRSDASSGTRYGISIVETVFTNLRIYGNEFAAPAGNWTKTINSAVGYSTALEYTRATADVNVPSVTPSATGVALEYSASGDDTNIDVRLKTKGTANLWLGNSYGDHLRVGPGSATIANYLQILGGAAGSPVTISPGGTDSNVGVLFGTKGNGKFTFSLTKVPTYADDAAAGAGGLTAGQMYKTAAGAVMLKL